ncbi:MAG: hypothetical protein K2M79_07140 [Muribaculaceae bacterium]|nr:hypothetical protein [Muribaculaceae bacterium]
MTRYDFKEATCFLNECVPLSDMYEDVLMAMHLLSAPKRYLTKKKRAEIWLTLMTCADFLDTINPKQKGGGNEVA